MSSIEVYQKITQFVDIFEFSKRELEDTSIKSIFGGKTNTKQYYYVALYFLYKLCNDPSNEEYKTETLRYLTLDLRVGNNKLRTIFAIANFYSFVGDNEEAVQYFQAGIKTKDSRFMSSFGNHYMKLGLYSEATTPYLMAIENGDNTRLNHLGYCYDRLGQLDKAINFFKKAVINGDIFALDNIGFIYQHCLGNTHIALKYYQKAIEMGNLFAIEHYLTINNNIDNVVRHIQTGISKDVCYSFTTHKDFVREKKNTYLYNNQVLLYYFRKCVNDDKKFAYQSPDDKSCQKVLKFRKQIMNMTSGSCNQCFDETMCISDENINKRCVHCHIQFLYSKKI